MTTLSQLINARMNIPGQEVSLDGVVERAQKAGEKLGRSNLHKLTREAPVSLTRATIYGLAAGLGVTPLTVANAALESMGINPRPIEVTDSLSTISIDPTLSEQDRKYLTTLIKEMRNDSHSDTALPGPPQPRASGKAERKDQEAKPQGLSDTGQGSRPDDRRQSDYDLASDRTVGTKSKRQLQRERDEHLGEESQDNLGAVE